MDELVRAILNDNTSQFNYLLNYIDVRSPTDYGTTPLYVAASYGHTDYCFKLLRAGADPNEKTSGLSPLHAAVDSGSLNCIRLFLSSGVGTNINSTTPNGDTALHIAAFRYRNPAIVRLLLSSGLNTTLRNYKGKNAREMALANGHIAIANEIQRHVLCASNGEAKTDTFIAGSACSYEDPLETLAISLHERPKPLDNRERKKYRVKESIKATANPGLRSAREAVEHEQRNAFMSSAGSSNDHVISGNVHLRPRSPKSLNHELEQLQYNLEKSEKEKDEAQQLLKEFQEKLLMVEEENEDLKGDLRMHEDRCSRLRENYDRVKKELDSKRLECDVWEKRATSKHDSSNLYSDELSADEHRGDPSVILGTIRRYQGKDNPGIQSASSSIPPTSANIFDELPSPPESLTQSSTSDEVSVNKSLALVSKLQIWLKEQDDYPSNLEEGELLTRSQMPWMIGQSYSILPGGKLSVVTGSNHIILEFDILHEGSRHNLRIKCCKNSDDSMQRILSTTRAHRHVLKPAFHYEGPWDAMVESQIGALTQGRAITREFIPKRVQFAAYRLGSYRDPYFHNFDVAHSEKFARRPVSICYQIVQAVDYLHQKGIGQLDVSNENVLLDGLLNAKLIISSNAISEDDMTKEEFLFVRRNDSHRICSFWSTFSSRCPPNHQHRHQCPLSIMSSLLAHLLLVFCSGGQAMTDKVLNRVGFSLFLPGVVNKPGTASQHQVAQWLLAKLGRVSDKKERISCGEEENSVFYRLCSEFVTRITCQELSELCDHYKKIFKH